MVGGWLSPLVRVVGVVLGPVHSKQGVGLWALGDSLVSMPLRVEGNPVRLVSQSSVTFRSCRWKDSGSILLVPI